MHVAEVVPMVLAVDAVVVLSGVGEQAVGANGGLQSMGPRRKVQQNKRLPMTLETKVLWIANLWMSIQLSKPRHRARGRGLILRKLLPQTQWRPPQIYSKQVQSWMAAAGLAFSASLRLHLPRPRYLKLLPPMRLWSRKLLSYLQPP